MNLGNALAANGGHLDEAIQQLNKGIELQPESASAQNGLGVALARAGRLDDAVLHMEKAVSLAPQAADYRYNFGRVLAAKGDLSGGGGAVRGGGEAYFDARAGDSGDAGGDIFRHRSLFGSREHGAAGFGVGGPAAERWAGGATEGQLGAVRRSGPQRDGADGDTVGIRRSRRESNIGLSSQPAGFDRSSERAVLLGAANRYIIRLGSNARSTTSSGCRRRKVSATWQFQQTG